MERAFCYVMLNIVLLLSNVEESYQSFWGTTDELENHISPEDLGEFMKINDTRDVTKFTKPGLVGSLETTTDLPVPENVDCFGLGPYLHPIVSILNMKPDSPSSVNTHFYFSSRNMPSRVQVFPGAQFRLESVDFKPTRKTVMIVHGFMSHSNASWVNDMTRAFLAWDDVNVIAVDWSGGASTWKYWRAVANVRRVGSDIVLFMGQLIKATNASTKDMHFVGHSLGAHITSHVSWKLGKVARITGLDPAQPCFGDTSSDVRLEPSDADFVDVIHTNGRFILKFGLGLPDPSGHADFYPNGGMKQPGCLSGRFYPFESTIRQAMCSHGRSYMLFTESLMNKNCSFRAHKWDLTYEGANASLIGSACDGCSEMGIRSIGIGGVKRANGKYFVLTTDNEPYCPTESERRHPDPELLKDLRNGFLIDRQMKMTTTKAPATKPSLQVDPKAKSLVKEDINTTTPEGWFGWIG